ATAPETFFKLVTGPDDLFAPVRKLLRSGPAPKLVINLMGKRANVTLEGEPGPRPAMRHVEILTAMARTQQEEGRAITTDELVEFLSPNDETPITESTVRSLLSNMRGKGWPMTAAGEPPRITTTYEVDALTLLERLKDHDLP